LAQQRRVSCCSTNVLIVAVIVAVHPGFFNTSIILTSLFITFVAWLFIKQTGNQKTSMLLLVFFITLPVSLILNLFNPITHLISNIFLPMIRDNVSAFLVPLCTLTILTSLFFTCIAWYFPKSRKTQIITKRDAHTEKGAKEQSPSDEGK